jgi:hypothetical protein
MIKYTNKHTAAILLVVLSLPIAIVLLLWKAGESVATEVGNWVVS